MGNRGNKDYINMLREIFDYVKKQEFSLKTITPVLSLLCGKDVSQNIEPACDFERKIRRFLNNKKNVSKLDSPVEPLYESKIVKLPDFIGPMCQEIGLTRSVFESTSCRHIYSRNDKPDIP